VGLDVAIHYAAGARAGERVEARAEESSRSRGVASYRVAVTGDDGRPLCVVVATAYRTREWHLGVDAWPEQWRAAH
jgi:acyl-coenzyme A thioesterase PaaI-like protein